MKKTVDLFRILFLYADDSKWLGDVCRAFMGTIDPDALDAGTRQVVRILKEYREVERFNQGIASGAPVVTR